MAIYISCSDNYTELNFQGSFIPICNVPFTVYSEPELASQLEPFIASSSSIELTPQQVDELTTHILLILSLAFFFRLLRKYIAPKWG